MKGCTRIPTIIPEVKLFYDRLHCKIKWEQLVSNIKSHETFCFFSTSKLNNINNINVLIDNKMRIKKSSIRILKNSQDNIRNNNNNCNKNPKMSIFYDEVNDKKNIENNINILNIIKNSTIEKLTVSDCTFLLNCLIKNKKNKGFTNELKNLNKIKINSSLYKEAISKILKNILTFNYKDIIYFFNKIAELSDLTSLKIIFLQLYNQHLYNISLYHLTDIVYTLAILNYCSIKDNEVTVIKFVKYIILNIMKENKNVNSLKKKIINKINIQIMNDKNSNAVYIKSVYNKSSTKKINKNKIQSHDSYYSMGSSNNLICSNKNFPSKNINKVNIKYRSLDEPFIQKNRHNNKCLLKYSHEDVYMDTQIKKHNMTQDETALNFDLNSLSNVMLYKLIYGFVKINIKKDLIKDLFFLLIPYIRYRIQNHKYVYSKNRHDIIVKIIWSFAFLNVRDIHLFIDFSICIQLIILNLKLEYLKILKNIYEKLAIFDELLLDKLSNRIEEIERENPQQFSHARKKQFKKKKKKRIEITDDIKLDRRKKVET
ncbi:conserved protein, unknown function [Hepatocystis sp. ex Piliocolobus tephrosceles]|nr:conserved protein, unknown function [Hepatocystis sp. ex Piliocolobus tephrosceles]